MRELLTGLAIILIIVLTTILVGPYFVDWNGQRGFLEARLGKAIGQQVTIGGNIDLKLLPTPYLVLDQVVVGGDDGPVRIGIHHLDLELSAAPLLHGEFDITEARLEEPTVRMSLQPDRTLPALSKAPAFAADVRFDRIHVSDGTLAVADPTSGHTFVFDHLDLNADAGSLSGPFKIDGRTGPDGARTRFRIGTAAPQKGRSHVRLIVDETAAHAGYEFDGNVDLQGGTEKGGAENGIRQSFEGSVAVTGRLAPGGDVSVPWKLSGPFKADPKGATLDGGELRLGGEDDSLTLAANVKGVFDDDPHMAVDLAAKQLDIDRLSGAPADANKPPPPPKMPDLTTLRHMLGGLRPPLRTALDVSIETATYGGDTLSNLQAHLGLGEATQPLKLSAEAPGDTRFALDGTLTTSGNSVFNGNVALAIDNLPRTVDWLASVAPSFPWKAADLPFQAVKLDGRVKTGGDTIDSDRLVIKLDRSVLKGKAHVAFGEGARATKIAADLTSDPLDLDGLPSLGAISGAANPFDLDLKLAAKAMNVARVGDGPLKTGPLTLAITRSGRRIELKELDADDLGGAKVHATGSFEPQHAILAMTLDARRLDRLAGLVAQLAPGAVAKGLSARASALAPAKIKVDADLAGSALSPSRVTISGTLGTTKVEASAKPDRDQPGATTIAAAADSPNGGALLAQLGFKTLPVASVGPSHLSLSARGRRGGKVETTLGVTLGATQLDATGGFDLYKTKTTGAGTMHLQSPDVTPLLQSLAVAFPDLSGRVPMDLNGGVTLDEIGPKISALKGRIAGVGLEGALAWHKDAGDKPVLTGTLDLDRISLANLVGLALGSEQEPAAGAVWSQQPFAGGLADPPHSVIALKTRSLEIKPGLTASNASLDLGIAPDVLTLDKVRADLNDGQVNGAAKLRRDGQQATIEGQVAFDHVQVKLPVLDTLINGHLDFAGTGATSLSLVSSLAGSGSVTTPDLTIKNSDPAALPKIFDDVENDILTVDQEAVEHAFDEAATGSLTAGARHFGLGLVSGVLRFNPKDPALPEKGPVATKVDGSFDLVRSKFEMNIGETLLALPKNWSGPPPTVIVKMEGALDKPSRTHDVSGFLNALAARALARETARVEAYEFDLRERAFFNARLQTERRREQERQLAAEKARQAEDDRKAHLEAIRQERLRQEQQEKDGTAPSETGGQPTDIRPLPGNIDGPPRPPRRPSSADERKTRGPGGPQSPQGLY